MKAQRHTSANTCNFAVFHCANAGSVPVNPVALVAKGRICRDHHMRRVFTSLAGVSVLTACGGGGFSAPDPVFATGPAPSGIADVVDLDFPLRISFGEMEGSSIQLGRTVLGLTFTSETTAILHTPRGSVDLSESGDSFVGTLDGRDYTLQFADIGTSYSNLVLVTEEDAPIERRNFGIFGLQTSPAGVDDLITNDITINYNGASILAVASASDGDIIEGTAQISVQFGTGFVGGAAWIGGDGSQLNIIGGALTETGITGDLELSGPLTALVTVSEADLDGVFFGTTGEELGGTYAGSGTLNGDAAELVGTFLLGD